MKVGVLPRLGRVLVEPVSLVFLSEVTDAPPRSRQITSSAAGSYDRSPQPSATRALPQDSRRREALPADSALPLIAAIHRETHDLSARKIGFGAEEDGRAWSPERTHEAVLTSPSCRSIASVYRAEANIWYSYRNQSKLQTQADVKLKTRRKGREIRHT